MKIINYESSRLTALFTAAGVGRVYLPKAVQLLAERYRFVGVPNRLEELSGEKVSFKHGVLNDIAIEALDIYNDGIIVSAKAASDILDDFVQDFCGWMENELGVERVETHGVNRAYESTLLIHSTAPLLRAVEALAPIQELLRRSVKSAMKVDAKFEPFGLSIAADHAHIPSMKPIAFRVERKATMAFEENFYVSGAPLPTADHIKVLERLEKLV